MTDAPRKEAAPKKIGRPSMYTAELVAEFCRRIVEGRGVMSVCEDDDMPSHDTIFRWQREMRPFAEALAHARAERTEAFSGQIVALSERALTDTKLDPARIRVAIDALDKAARLMQPRKVELTGANGGPIPVASLNLSQATDDQLAALEAFFGPLAGSGLAETD
jgi:hypothetical protein